MKSFGNSDDLEQGENKKEKCPNTYFYYIEMERRGHYVVEKTNVFGREESWKCSFRSFDNPLLF
jgi:hypothetical protein